MITPVQLNAVISRSQDVTNLKQNEDNKGLVDNQNFQTHFNKEVDTHIKTVHEADNAENMKKRYDAKDKGDNEYEGDGGKNRKQKKNPADGKVFVKKTSGFDMKV